jgi:Virulence protein
MNKPIDNFGEIIIYTSSDGINKVDVRFVNNTVWLSQQQIADLFETSRTNVVGHIGNIYDEGELDKQSTCKEFRQVQKEGNRTIARNIPFYNLDVIVSVGYRIKSKIATSFRKWATERLTEYMLKGFTMDDDRLKNLCGGLYWKELLDRIRSIRSSEKVFYRQVLDLFATSIDYNPKSEEAKYFFATVQNKMHFAVHKQTASEVIFDRVDSNKRFVGLTTFSGEEPTVTDLMVAKNYLTEDELKRLNALVSGYLDFAELQANSHNAMTMKNWIEHVDRILAATGSELLQGNGKVSREQMFSKVHGEYKKYSENTLTKVEQDYLNEIRSIHSISKENEEMVRE